MKNSLIKVLSLVMALTMIVGCFSAITFSAAECTTHTKGDKVGETVPATCANIGYTLYECATCGVTYPDDVVPKAADHTGIVDVPATSATCAYPAMTAGKTCTDCCATGTYLTGFEPEIVEDSAPLGHKFVGAHKGTVCDLEYYYVCSVCGLTAEECYKIENEDDFDEEDFDIDIDDYKEYFSDTSKALGHAWDYVVKTAPETCKDGLTVATCDRCGTVEEIAIRAPHKYDGNKTFLSCEDYIGKKCDLCGAPALDAVVNEDPQHAWTNVTVMNSTLQGMGYTSVYVAPTCGTAGYQIQQCACGEYRELPSAATGHVYGTWSAEGGARPTTANAEVCVTAKTLTRKCNFCDVKETVIGVALKEHVYVSEVTEPTCEAEGYTTLTCIYPGCHYATTPVVSNYTAKLGHNYGEWETVGSADNHAADYKQVRACVNEGCNKTETKMIVAAIAAAPEGTTAINGHYFIDDDKADTVVAANCTTPAYSAYVCVVDGCTATTPINGDVESSKINDEKNTAVHDMTASTFVKLYTVKAPTCTATGTDKYICKNPACNNVEVDVTVPAKGHDDPSLWVNYKDANNNNKVDSGESLAAVPATCTSTGKTEGLVCKSCKTVMVAQQTVAINPENHQVLSNGSYVDVTPTLVTDKVASCSSVGYKTYFYSCCKQYVTEYPEDSTYADINPTGHVWKTVKYKAAVCGVNGNHAYKECQECKTVEFITSGENACTCGASHSNIPVEIVADPHNFSNLIPALAETCTTAGYTAHYECSNTGCDVTDGKVIIPAHGNAYKVVYKDTTVNATGINTPATHTEAGIKAGTFCEKCDKLAGTDKGINDAGWYIAPVGHDAAFATPVVVNASTADDYDCTLPTYNVYSCSCGATYADTFVAAKASEHVYEAVWHKYTIKDNKLQLDGKDVDPVMYACNPEAYTGEYRDCQNCDQRETKNVQAPINHYATVNGAKVDILLDCKNIADAVGLSCDICKVAFTAQDVTHNPAHSVKEATCSDAGYDLIVCIDCGEYLDVYGKVPSDPADAWNTVVPAIGHKPYVVVDPTKPYAPNNFRADTTGKNLYAIDSTVVNYVVEEKAPTFGADGYIKYMCKNCGEVVTYVIPFNSGIEFGMVATPGFTGNQVALTIKVSAKEYAFQTITLVIPYANGLALATDKKVETNYEFPATDNVTVRARDNGGFVVVTIYAPNNVETGKAKNTVISGDDADLVTLYFDVLPFANGANFGLFVDEIYDAVEEEKLDNYAYASTLDVDSTHGAPYMIKDYATTLVGDANFDGYIDAADSVAVMEANYTAVYNAALDFNADGKVDLDDHMALVNYYTSDRSYYDFLELIGVDYMDYVNNYNLRVDLDGDKAVTENDRSRIAIELVEDLKWSSVEYGFASDVNFMIADIVEDLLDDGLRNGSNID